jgi:hypothetical protein
MVGWGCLGGEAIIEGLVPELDGVLDVRKKVLEGLPFTTTVVVAWS